MGSYKDCCKRYKGCQDRCPSFVAERLVEEDIHKSQKHAKMLDKQTFAGIDRSRKRTARRNNSKTYKHMI